MRLTLYTDYSLRVLLYLATHQGQRATISDIADAYQISRNHLVKVVHQLSLNGWISTTRGKSGGMSLAFPPERINVGTVVRQTEPHMNLLECFDKQNNQCAISPACQLKQVLYQARKAFCDVLDGCTLADVIGGGKEEVVRILDANIVLARAKTPNPSEPH